MGLAQYIQFRDALVEGELRPGRPSPPSHHPSLSPSNGPSSPGPETGGPVLKPPDTRTSRTLARRLCGQKQLSSEGPCGRLPSKEQTTFCSVFLTFLYQNLTRELWVMNQNTRTSRPQVSCTLTLSCHYWNKNQTKPLLPPHSPSGPFLVRDTCVP